MPKLVEFEGQTHEFPDDFTDADIAEALSSTPAAPAASPQTSAKPADPSLVDTIMNGANYAAETTAQGLRGIRKGVANLFGIPVHLINQSPQLLNLVPGIDGVRPFSDKPFMGPEALDEALGAPADALASLFGRENSEPPAPQDMLQRGVKRVGEELGAAAVPAGSALMAASRLGVQGARELPSLIRMFVEPAAVNPARFAGKEAAAATAAGTGASTVNELTRVAGYKDGSTGQQVGDLLGALLGVGTYGIGSFAVERAGNVARALTKPATYEDTVVRGNVADILAEQGDASIPYGATGRDTTDLVNTIMNGNRPAEVIPGFQESLADRTQNPGIAALEYQRQSGPNAREFVQRRSDNTGAIDDALNANAPQGQPGAFRSELELERDRRLMEADVAARNAADDARAAAAPLQPRDTPAQRGNTVRTALEESRDAARARTEEAYDAADITGRQIDPAQLTQTLDEAVNGLTEVERGLVPQGVIDRVRSLGRPVEEAPVPTGILGPDGRPLTRPPAPPEPVSMKEATDLRSELQRLRAAALADPRAERGGRNAGRVLKQMTEAVDGFITRNITKEEAKALEKARGAKFDEAEAFTRKGDPVAAALSRHEGGQPRMRDDRVAGTFVDPQNLDRLFAQADTPQVRAAIRNEVLSRGDTSSAQGIRDFTTDYGQQIDRFPGLRQELDAAAVAREAEGTAATNQQGILREIGPQGRGTVAKYLAYGDEKAEAAMNEVFRSKEPTKAIDELLTFVNDDPAAVEGARGVFWDLMQKSSRSGGETTKTMSGEQPWLPDKLKKFLNDPSKAAVAERLYRDNPEHLENVRTIADAIQNVDVRLRAKAPNTSGTAQGVNQVLTPETLQSRLYAYKRGQVSGSFLVTSILGVAYRRGMNKVRGAAVERVLDKALLNPDFAAQLLKDNNPANRAALARKAKGWLGNEASTLLDLLNDEDDPVKDAVTR